ncbi:MAG: hypothetical protein SGCHY_002639 [Lobulomycetales sp.]
MGVQIQIVESLGYAAKLSSNERFTLSCLERLKESFPPAQFTLSFCYYDGTGRDKDHSVAFELMKRAALLDLSAAQNSLGNFYIEGAGCNVDVSQGLRWLVRAARGRDPSSAIYNIGTMYEAGIGVSQDASMAYQWYRRAASLGSLQSFNSLGVMQEHGVGTTQSMEAAFTSFSKGAIMGHPESQYNLARCLHNGIGCTKYDRGAYCWFQIASSQMHAKSLFSLAICIEHGIGCTENFAEAIKTYNRAYSKGSQNALKRLQPLIASELLCTSRVLFFSKKKRKDGGASIADLPFEVIERILSFIDDQSILSVGQRIQIVNEASDFESFSEVASLWNLVGEKPELRERMKQVMGNPTGNFKKELSLSEQLYEFVLEPVAPFFTKENFMNKVVGIDYHGRSECCKERECKLISHWKSLCEY